MQLASSIADLVQRCEPAATRQDLVLAKYQLAVMDQIALRWRARTQDLASWGVAVKGRAISALFTGPRGTGKTMAAEVLANETRLAFCSIDLGRVVSKYLGETEKRLGALFDLAQEASALLFLDEADALFAKRGEVKDAHDRYANIDVSGLMQRIEDYGGIVILATNLKEGIDPAFLRQLSYVVDFPLPDSAQRVKIWLRIFPPDTPVEGLDPERLARLPLSGANIRDIARSSASLAASEGQPVRMSHLLRAAQCECAKINRQIDVAQIARP
jgi:SpoVK/Ycf46/Vps4 family AAA+-type ATPase